MNWKVRYSDRARRDLRGIYEYIARTLFSPETASERTARIMKKIRSLEKMPARRRLYGKEPRRSPGLRFFPADNCLVFCLSDESDRRPRHVRR